MKLIEKIEEMLSEATKTKKVDDKPLAASKLKWAATRYKDITKWVKDLEGEIASGDKGAMRASINTIKSLIDTIERGLDLWN